MLTNTRSSTPRGRLRSPLSPRRPALPNPDDPLGLFGDGPPTWIINKDKLWERPSSSAGEATKQRKATVLRLRWHANHVALLAGKGMPPNYHWTAKPDGPAGQFIVDSVNE